MNDDYNPNSMNAVLSRIEAKLDAIVVKLNKHDEADEDLWIETRKLWKALGRLDVRVALIAGGISSLGMVIKIMWHAV